MFNKRLISITICWILVAVPGLSVSSFADNESQTNAEAEQHFQKANDLHILADYDAAISEFEAVISSSPNSVIAQNAQYWIGQLYFESGQLDTALSTFEKLIEDFPTSLVVPTTKIMIERVQQAQKNLALYEATQNGDIEQVKLLIAQGADVNTRYEQAVGLGSTPLLIASGRGNFEIVKVLLDSGADVNIEPPGLPLAAQLVRPVDASFSLNFAVSGNHKDIVELLVDRGAEYDANINDNMTVLHIAAMTGNRDMVEYLISNKGVDTSGFHWSAFMGNLDRVKEFVEKETEVDVKDGAGWIPLFWAACAGQTEVVEFLIDNGADINATGLLHYAVGANAVEVVELLISKGVSVDVTNDLGATPLIAARHRDIAELLIAKGADVNNKNIYDYTPLHGAAAYCPEVAELLIENGADVNARTLFGETPLFGAAENGHQEIVELLISKGADVNISNNVGITPLSAAEQNHAEIAELLREHGAEASEIGTAPPPRGGGVGAELGSSPLHEAAAGGDIEQVKQLISEGAEVDVRDNRDGTPLHYAAANGRLEVAEFLIENGADVNARIRVNFGGTPLLLASRFGHQEMVELLIAEGADVNISNIVGATPLAAAEQNGHAEIAELLREYGAESSETGTAPPPRGGGVGAEFGSSPLHEAAAAGDIEQVKQLISEGSEVDVKDNRNGTPLHDAAANGRLEVAEFLIENGADVNARVNFGGTPLLLASRFGHQEMVELLIAEGADVNISNIVGATPLVLAVENGYAEIVELLREYEAEE